jgi:hypothetical protein
MTDPHDAARRLRAYLNARPGAHSLGGSIEYGPEFTAAGNRPAGGYALDRADLEAVLDALTQATTCGHGADRHGPEAGCVECRCTATAGHG